MLIVLVFYIVLSIFNSDGAQIEFAWLLGMSYHVASLALWSYGHVYLINATTTAEGSEYHPRMTQFERPVCLRGITETW